LPAWHTWAQVACSAVHFVGFRLWQRLEPVDQAAVSGHVSTEIMQRLPRGSMAAALT
jgi:hypothetical protein